MTVGDEMYQVIDKGTCIKTTEKPTQNYSKYHIKLRHKYGNQPRRSTSLFSFGALLNPIMVEKSLIVPSGLM